MQSSGLLEALYARNSRDRLFLRNTSSSICGPLGRISVALQEESPSILGDSSWRATEMRPNGPQIEELVLRRNSRSRLFRA